MSCKGNCGCGFGKRTSAFGKGADAFFANSFSGPTSINSINKCLSGMYYSNNKAPISRFGASKKSNGPMKIKNKK